MFWSEMAVTAYGQTEEELKVALRDLVIDEGSLGVRVKLCELARCKGMCCHDGVYVGEEERALLEEVYGSVCEQRDGKWKTRTVAAEGESLGEGFPDHFPRTRCVFLDGSHCCELQKRALREGLHPWFYKPMPCWLHPLTIVRLPNGRPLLSLPSRGDDPQEREGYAGFASCTTCGKEDEGGEWARVVLAEEISFLKEVLGRK